MLSNSMSVNHRWKWFRPILYKNGWGYNSLFILSQDQHSNQISANHWQVFLLFFLRAQNGLVCTNPSPYLVLSEDISEICKAFWGQCGLSVVVLDFTMLSILYLFYIHVLGGPKHHSFWTCASNTKTQPCKCQSLLQHIHLCAFAINLVLLLAKHPSESQKLIFIKYKVLL